VSLQDILEQRTHEWKQKNFDIHIDMVGNEVNAIALTEQEINHYGDVEITLGTNDIITAYIDFPDNEIPITFETANQTESHFHLYDVLPIEGYFKFVDSVKVGQIIIFKVNLPNSDNTNKQLIALQILKPRVRAMKYVTWRKFTLAPYTLPIEKYPELKTILDDLLAS
jgi:hypothetical protein